MCVCCVCVCVSARPPCHFSRSVLLWRPLHWPPLEGRPYALHPWTCTRTLWTHGHTHTGARRLLDDCTVLRCVRTSGCGHARARARVCVRVSTSGCLNCRWHSVDTGARPIVFRHTGQHAGSRCSPSSLACMCVRTRKVWSACLTGCTGACVCVRTGARGRLCVCACVCVSVCVCMSLTKHGCYGKLRYPRSCVLYTPYERLG